jgi:hypothetical protein
MSTSRISVKGLGLAMGVFWGVSMLVIGLVSYVYGYGLHIVEAMSAVYLGYHTDLLGSFIGGFVGFIDGFITGSIIAWLYNCFAHCGSGSCKK